MSIFGPTSEPEVIDLTLDDSSEDGEQPASLTQTQMRSILARYGVDVDRYFFFGEPETTFFQKYYALSQDASDEFGVWRKFKPELLNLLDGLGEMFRSNITGAEFLFDHGLSISQYQGIRIVVRERNDYRVYSPRDKEDEWKTLRNAVATLLQMYGWRKDGRDANFFATKFNPCKNMDELRGCIDTYLPSL